ncbi:MAG: hypothetical protein ACK55Z_20680, partial [bacterium]
QAGYKGLSRGGHHHGQRVLCAPHGRGWKRPGDPCVRGRGDSDCGPHKATAPREGDLPYHPARCTVDGNESRARGVAHRARQQAVVAHPRGGLVGPRRRYEADEVSVRPSVHDHRRLGERPPSTRQCP